MLGMRMNCLGRAVAYNTTQKNHTGGVVVLLWFCDDSRVLGVGINIATKSGDFGKRVLLKGPRERIRAVAGVKGTVRQTV